VNARVVLGALLMATAIASLHAQTPATSAKPIKPIKPIKVDTSPKAVAAAAAAYVVAYQKDLAFVVADELSVQRVMTTTGAAIDSRRTRAEFFLTYAPNEGTWMSVRDVQEVDGTEVHDPEDIRTLIQRAPISQLGAVIAQKNSRYNIGNVRRTFNEPTIGLLVVNPLHQRRFKFERVAVSKAASPVVTLKFTERERPTLVSGARGEPVFTRGELDVDAVTGRVERTRIELRTGTVRGVLTTAYAPDGKLNLWVPASMSERYENASGIFSQTVTVDSDYTNYRRFDTTVIIK